MPAEEANVSAFAAYSQSNSSINNSTKKKSKSGQKATVGDDEFLTAELKKYVQKSKKKPRNKKNDSQAEVAAVAAQPQTNGSPKIAAQKPKV